MNKVAKITIWIVGTLALGIGALFVAFYFEIKAGLEADLKACKTVQPVQAADAVINDVLQSGNQLFAKYNLSADDIAVDRENISIGQSAILVPFRVSTEPNRRYFGMPRCAVLNDVEYGLEDLNHQ